MLLTLCTPAALLAFKGQRRTRTGGGWGNRFGEVLDVAFVLQCASSLVREVIGIISNTTKGSMLMHDISACG